jgi:hypothetical protein
MVAATLKNPMPTPTLRTQYIRLAKDLPLPSLFLMALYRNSI